MTTMNPYILDPWNRLQKWPSYVIVPSTKSGICLLILKLVLALFLLRLIESGRNDIVSILRISLKRTCSFSSHPLLSLSLSIRTSHLCLNRAQARSVSSYKWRGSRYIATALAPANSQPVLSAGEVASWSQTKLPTYRIMSWIRSCYFKPQSFMVICYTPEDNK